MAGLIHYIMESTGIDKVDHLDGSCFMLEHCPKCGKGNSFTINAATSENNFSCLDCCEGGPVEFLTDIEGMPLDEAIEKAKEIEQKEANPAIDKFLQVRQKAPKEAPVDDQGASRPEDILSHNTVAEYLGTGFRLDQKERIEEPEVATGLFSLDEALGGGLYPGLFAIGSMPSLGKTAFVMQMADHIASQGRRVLFFSLEMSRYELVCRSLTRIMYLNGTRIATGSVLSGEYDGKDLIELDGYKEALKQLKDGPGKYLTINECNYRLNIDAIEKDIQNYIERTLVKPVIFVDYLQIVQPNSDGTKKTDKQNIDIIITELKRISRKLGVPIVLISSFNRTAYNESASFSSFKESGSIEYTTDVLAVLELRYKPTDKKGKVDEEALNQIKNQEPRELRLVLLKNRRGKAYETIDIDYWPRFNFFKVSGETKDIETPF